MVMNFYRYNSIPPAKTGKAIIINRFKNTLQTNKVIM